MTETTIGKYRILGELGRGAMGTVYKAVDETLQREVAIKILSPAIANAGLLERFRTEATALARLNHAAIATIYELVQSDDDLVMVMELVRGETLEVLGARQGPFEPARAVHLVDQILSGLEHAHRAGIVHCDIKPANVMVTDSGGVKIMDFGIAHVCGDDLKTAAGGMRGTPGYMAPEQALGQDVDARADLYAVGVVLYRLLAGALPFAPGTMTEILRQQIAEGPAPLDGYEGGLPDWCDSIIARALAKTPADRFQTAEEFRAVLARATRPTILERTDKFAPDDLAYSPSGPAGWAAAVPAVLGSAWLPEGRDLAALLKGLALAAIGLAAVAYGVHWRATAFPVALLPSTVLPSMFIPPPVSMSTGPSTRGASALGPPASGSRAGSAEAPPAPVGPTAPVSQVRTPGVAALAAARPNSPGASPAVAPVAAADRAVIREDASDEERVGPPPDGTLVEKAAGGSKAFLPFAFSAKKLIEGGDQFRERDVRVFLADGRVIVAGEALPNDVVHEKTYEAIRAIAYSKSHHPLWRSPAGPARAASAGRVGVFPRTRHWITLRTDDPASPLIVLRVESEAEMKHVIEAIEERTRLVVSTLAEKPNGR